jgi:hypothetical protein
LSDEQNDEIPSMQLTEEYRAEYMEPPRQPGLQRAVSIVGFASSSRGQAPYNDPGHEIWTMNHAPLSFIPTWHVLFELHTLEHLQKVSSHGTEASPYMKWLSEQPGPEDPKHCPIYMQQHHDSIPASVAIPREEMNAWFAERGGNIKGCFAGDYYTSTISYMLALAIMQGREEIHLYGIDLLQDEEYAYQRPGCEYLVGFARGMGIKVYIPEQSALCAANYVYGYSEPASDFANLTPLIDYIDDKAKVSDANVVRARQDANTFHGALQAFDMVLGWQAAGGEEVKAADGTVTRKTVGQLIKEKREELAGKFNSMSEAVLTMSGQAEAFRTSAIWAKHYARGGALKS